MVHFTKKNDSDKKAIKNVGAGKTPTAQRCLRNERKQRITTRTIIDQTLILPDLILDAMATHRQCQDAATDSGYAFAQG